MLIHRAVLKLIDVASREASCFQLNGVYVKRDGDHIEACATSGKILAIVRHKVEEHPEDFPGKLPTTDGTEANGCILPRSFICKVARFFKAAGSKVFHKPIMDFFNLRAEEHDVQAETVDQDLDVTRLSGKAIEGSFPDYASVTEPGPGLKVRLSPEYLLDAAKLILALAKETGGSGTIEMIVSEKETNGYSNSPVHLLHKSPDGLESKVLIMPLVSEKS